MHEGVLTAPWRLPHCKNEIYCHLKIEFEQSLGQLGYPSTFYYQNIVSWWNWITYLPPKEKSIWVKFCVRSYFKLNTQKYHIGCKHCVPSDKRFHFNNILFVNTFQSILIMSIRVFIKNEYSPVFSPFLIQKRMRVSCKQFNINNNNVKKIIHFLEAFVASIVLPNTQKMFCFDSFSMSEWAAQNEPVNRQYKHIKSISMWHDSIIFSSYNIRRI